MKPNLHLVDTDTTRGPEQAHELTIVQTWRERPISDRWLVRGQDEVGRRGWFLRFEVTGLYTRRVGPFPTRAAALERLEELLATIITDPLCTLQNELSAAQRCVVEGIPRLMGRSR